jgi:ribosomal protein S18 acetylase RimI-like enzyme
MSELTIRPIRRDELDTMIDWAAAEGWNPGLHDADPFHAADPEGFLMGFIGDEPVACISVVNYGDSYGFLGFYICRPEHRGKGYGIQLWNAGMERMGARTVGLDGVVEQQDKYARSGFELAHRNIRYGGAAQNIGPTDPAVLELGPDTPPILVDAVVAYDRQFFPASRDGFIRRWLEPGARRAVAYVSDRTLLGHGVIRPCRDGHKIGPLFADDAEIAEALFNALVAPLGDAPLVFLDVPEPNEAARLLAERHGLEPVFETARMYKGAAPDLPLDRIFGITTFELG